MGINGEKFRARGEHLSISPDEPENLQFHRKIWRKSQRYECVKRRVPSRPLSPGGMGQYCKRTLDKHERRSLVRKSRLRGTKAFSGLTRVDRYSGTFLRLSAAVLKPGIPSFYLSRRKYARGITWGGRGSVNTGNTRHFQYANYRGDAIS